MLRGTKDWERKEGIVEGLHRNGKWGRIVGDYGEGYGEGDRRVKLWLWLWFRQREALRLRLRFWRG